jgi:hypothetical protein
VNRVPAVTSWRWAQSWRPVWVSSSWTAMRITSPARRTLPRRRLEAFAVGSLPLRPGDAAANAWGYTTSVAPKRGGDVLHESQRQHVLRGIALTANTPILPGQNSIYLPVGEFAWCRPSPHATPHVHHAHDAGVVVGKEDERISLLTSRLSVHDVDNGDG